MRLPYGIAIIYIRGSTVKNYSTRRPRAKYVILTIIIDWCSADLFIIPWLFLFFACLSRLTVSIDPVNDATLFSAVKWKFTAAIRI